VRFLPLRKQILSKRKWDYGRLRSACINAFFYWFHHIRWLNSTMLREISNQTIRISYSSARSHCYTVNYTFLDYVRVSHAHYHVTQVTAHWQTSTKHINNEIKSPLVFNSNEKVEWISRYSYNVYFLFDQSKMKCVWGKAWSLGRDINKEGLSWILFHIDQWARSNLSCCYSVNFWNCLKLFWSHRIHLIPK
jgi:hypothetical protein